jgi:hypothetical protein
MSATRFDDEMGVLEEIALANAATNWQLEDIDTDMRAAAVMTLPGWTARREFKNLSICGNQVLSKLSNGRALR